MLPKNFEGGPSHEEEKNQEASEESKFNSSEQELYQNLRGQERSIENENFVQKKFQESTEDLLEDSDEAIAVIDGGEGGEDFNKLNEQEPSEATRDSIEKIEELKKQLTDEKIQELGMDAFSRLRKFAKERSNLLQAKDKLKKNEQELVRRIYQLGLEDSPQIWGKVHRLQEYISKAQEKLEESSRKSPEAFKAHWLYNLREYKKQYKESGVIETPSIQKQTENLMHDIRKQMEGTNRVATMLGPTGSGKTVMAEKVAATLSPEGNYEFVSAHSKMDPEDLLMRQGIAIETIQPEDVPDSIEKAKQKYYEEHPDIGEDELRKAEEVIERVVQAQASEKAYQTKTILEDVGRAAQEGRVVVIDEFNYLPPQTLASLNKLLDTPFGKVANVSVGDKEQEFQVKEGFGVIFTGNVGREYIDRQENWDPALVNRILAGTVKYDYPPQDINSSFEKSIVSNEELVEGKESPDRELFLSGIVQLVDNKGNLTAPEDTLEKVWNLSRTFSLVQQIADGEDYRNLSIENTEMFQDISNFQFETIFLSFRNFNQVVREWKLDNYTQDLDSYIFENIIRPAEVINKKEAAQLFYLFQRWGNFFQSEKYNEVKVDSTSWRIGGLNNISKEQIKQEASQKHFTPKEVAEALSGKQTPSYEDLEEEKKEVRQETISREKEQVEMQEDVQRMEKELSKEIYIEEVCGESEV
jgi:MoxR-like ATPase